MMNISATRVIFSALVLSSYASLAIACSNDTISSISTTWLPSSPPPPSSPTSTPAPTPPFSISQPPKPTATTNQIVLTNDNPAFIYSPPGAWQDVSTNVPSRAASTILKVTNTINATITFNFTGSLTNINAITSSAGGLFSIQIGDETQTIDTFAAGLNPPFSSCSNFNLSSAITSATSNSNFIIDRRRFARAGKCNANTENEAQLTFLGGLPNNQQESGNLNSTFTFDSVTIENAAA